MVGIAKTAAAYLSRLSEGDYGPIQKSAAAVINYGLDSYFAKLQSLQPKGPRGPFPPHDLSSDIKEKWLGCEIHRVVTINSSYPAFSKSLNAHAFAMLFSPYGGELASYEAVNFLDQYAWKDLIKGSFEFRLQQESVQIAVNHSVTLPVYGTFFVTCHGSNVKLIVKIDLCYESMSCVFTVMSSPENKEAAETFLADLSASRSANDIYYKQCLAFEMRRLEFTQVSPTSWDQIILKSQLKDVIRQNTVGILENVDKLRSLGMTPSRNIMLISPPGMAKTTIFRAVTNEVFNEITVIWCTGKSIGNSRDVTSLFEAARSLAPCIIFIEDMDLFGRDRSSGMYGSDPHVLNEFLACLDGAKENSGVVVMASTNDIASMDEALVNRPGRFDVKVEIPFPDDEDRFKMLSAFLLSYHATIDSSITRNTITNVVNLTNGLTGAYIKDLVKTAVIRAVSLGQASLDGVSVNLTSDDLMSAAEQVMKNFEIGKRAKKHHVVDVSVASELPSKPSPIKFLDRS